MDDQEKKYDKTAKSQEILQHSANVDIIQVKKEYLSTNGNDDCSQRTECASTKCDNYFLDKFNSIFACNKALDMNYLISEKIKVERDMNLNDNGCKISKDIKLEKLSEPVCCEQVDSKSDIFNYPSKHLQSLNESLSINCKEQSKSHKKSKSHKSDKARKSCEKESHKDKGSTNYSLDSKISSRRDLRNSSLFKCKSKTSAKDTSPRYKPYSKSREIYSEKINESRSATKHKPSSRSQEKTNGTSKSCSSSKDKSVSRYRETSNKTSKHYSSSKETSPDQSSAKKDNYFKETINQSYKIKKHGHNKILLRKCTSSEERKRTNSIKTEEIDVVSSTSVKEDVFKCEKCQMEFKSQTILDYHSKDVHEEVNQCHICAKIFVCKSDFDKHKLEHAQKHVCHMCCNEFISESILKEHMLLHVKEEVFECNICSKKFDSADSLQTHKAKHEDVTLRFQCPICNKKFKYKFLLERHKITHDAKKPFNCEICKLGFNRKEQLNTHTAKSHTEIKPYICDLCPSSFYHAHSLRKHKNSKHSKKTKESSGNKRKR